MTTNIPWNVREILLKAPNFRENLTGFFRENSVDWKIEKTFFKGDSEELRMSFWFLSKTFVVKP